jgi:hypothetical protein
MHARATRLATPRVTMARKRYGSSPTRTKALVHNRQHHASGNRQFDNHCDPTHSACPERHRLLTDTAMRHGAQPRDRELFLGLDALALPMLMAPTRMKGCYSANPKRESIPQQLAGERQRSGCCARRLAPGGGTGCSDDWHTPARCGAIWPAIVAVWLGRIPVDFIMFNGAVMRCADRREVHRRT